GCRPRSRGTAPERHVARRDHGCGARSSDGGTGIAAAARTGGDRRHPALARARPVAGAVPFECCGRRHRLRTDGSNQGETAMARKPQQEQPEGTSREKIISAFMALLAERRIEEISFGDIAARAGLSLAQCRAEFGSLLAVLA